MAVGGRHQCDEPAHRVEADLAEMPVPVDSGQRGDGFGIGAQAHAPRYGVPDRLSRTGVDFGPNPTTDSDSSRSLICMDGSDYHFRCRDR